MAAILYYLFLPFIYLLSALPFRVLYLLSDFLYLVLYRIVGYRKQVVLQNMRNAFPEKTEAEINILCRKFFHHLCDLFVEVLKLMTINRQALLKRCRFTPEAAAVFEELAVQNRNIVLVLGHVGNWEWSGNSFSLECRHKLYVIYHPLANKQFDGLMYRMRRRFAARVIAMKNTYKEMLAGRGELNATAFLADQTPPPENAYWTTFLNQDTPVFKGTEVIARKLNYPVVYACVKKEKRGYYKIEAELLCANPAQTKENEISEMHTKRLEQDIRELPETWLWSHRRWKHKRPQA